ncbi:MAG TPA: tRNA (adenosine(37)-N6)-dimethylallyltransferase MiaA, partial [Bacteroidales bacterium]|nr:tRNA (adenosine(37)-N6)-dimethylallyltransferase MiaA [Bacteroidales bacterium]HPT52527.1 tRNA (adenosine(37)-N6)-dimethylallyltransferase MiaA [Bacteroidales bacterium]
LEHGMIEEVQNLIAAGANPSQLIKYGLEYKYVTLYLQGVLDWNTMFEKLNIAIHQFSKRQMTWYRRMERNGMKINWIEVGF